MTTAPPVPFEHLVMPHLDDAYTLARYLVRDEHDAQDVVQDAALRGLRAIAGYRGGDARSWFLAIVRNCAMDRLRERQSEGRMTELTDDVADARESDAEAMAGSEREQVGAAIAALPTDFREVIVLRELEGLSYEDISRVIDAPIGTVMSRLSRARRRLAVLLGGDAAEVG